MYLLLTGPPSQVEYGAQSCFTIYRDAEDPICEQSGSTTKPMSTEDVHNPQSNKSSLAASVIFAHVPLRLGSAQGDGALLPNRLLSIQYYGSTFVRLDRSAQFTPCKLLRRNTPPYETTSKYANFVFQYAKSQHPSSSMASEQSGCTSYSIVAKLSTLQAESQHDHRHATCRGMSASQSSWSWSSPPTTRDRLRSVPDCICGKKSLFPSRITLLDYSELIYEAHSTRHLP